MYPSGTLANRVVNKIRRISHRASERVHGIPLRMTANRVGRPIPPGRLIFLVANTEDVSWYLDTGALAAASIRDVLADNGYDITNFTSILDFGCGVGRTIRHWDRLDGPEIFGTDYNPDLIRWCRQRLAFANFSVNEIAGPLPYPDGQFDFIYALSVFTHLGESTQHFWMRELARVLKPGGLLLITAHGDHYLPALNENEQAAYRRGDLVVKKSLQEGSNNCAAFHPHEYVRNTLAKDYSIVAFRPEGALGNPSQDLYLLKKESAPRLLSSGQ